MAQLPITFGMPTLIELGDVAAGVDLCRRLGLSFIELNVDLPSCQPQSLPAESLQAWRRQQGVSFTIHLPERLDLAAFQPDLRNGHVACTETIIRWAGRAGVRKLNMHMNAGVYFTLPDQRVWLYERHCDVYMVNLLRSMDQIVPQIEAIGATLLVENTGVYGQPFIQQAVEVLLDRYGSSIGLTWDIGHDAESGYADSPFISRRIDRIAHVHLHDFDGKSAHQALFSGRVDLQAMLALAKQQGASVVIETKTVQSLESSIQALIRRGLM